MRKFEVKALVTKDAQTSIAQSKFERLSVTTSSKLEGAALNPIWVRLEISTGFSSLPDRIRLFDSFPTLVPASLSSAANALTNAEFNAFLEDRLKEDPDVYETLRAYMIPGPSVTSW